MGEIKIVSFNFAPQGWAEANGQLLPINQNQALFSLYGTTFGGNGQTNFAIPNLQGRAPLHPGAGYLLGQAGGEYNHTLSLSELPQHIHLGVGDTTTAPDSGGNTPSTTSRLAGSNPGNMYAAPSALIPMNGASVSNTGGSQPHSNTQPYLTLNFIVALIGVFPSRN
jgi:microcystin-dependent protein